MKGELGSLIYATVDYITWFVQTANCKLHIQRLQHRIHSHNAPADSLASWPPIWTSARFARCRS